VPRESNAAAGVEPYAGAPASPWTRARTVVADYADMTKPKVQSLLLFTTVATMYVAGDPSLGLVLVTCLGGALSA
jgi:protoheme IX farnesyltransferase